MTPARQRATPTLSLGVQLMHSERMNRSIATLSAYLLATTLTAACSDESVDAVETTPETPDPCAAEDAAGCLVNQQACALRDGAAVCEPCAAGQYADASGVCAPIEGTLYHHVFADFTTEPGQEVLGLCQSWTLGNETELWINTVELQQDEMSHHSNWTFVTDDKYEGPDGVWPCSDRNYDQLSAAVVGGVLYAQSTQATREVQRFPPGADLHPLPWTV